jgi:hypothetical protein
MNKRMFLKIFAVSTLASSSSLISRLSLALPPDAAFEKGGVADLIDDNGNIPTIAEYEKTFEFDTGIGNPFREEVALGNQMISATIPTNVTPYEVISLYTILNFPHRANADSEVHDALKTDPKCFGAGLTIAFASEEAAETGNHSDDLVQSRRLIR